MYIATEIRPGVFAIDDGNVRMYLICGTNRALLLDSGYGSGDLRSFIKMYYSGPIVLAHTHTHGDHVGADNQFESIYAAQEEWPDLISSGIHSNVLCPLQDGDIFDLGDRIIIAHDTPGHTVRSMSFSDDANRIFFTGDLVSDVAVYLCMPGSDLIAYQQSLQKLLGVQAKYDVFLGCHGKAEQYADAVQRLLNCANNVANKEGTWKVANPFADLFCQSFTFDGATLFLPLDFLH